MINKLSKVRKKKERKKERRNSLYADLNMVDHKGINKKEGKMSL